MLPYLWENMFRGGWISMSLKDFIQEGEDKHFKDFDKEEKPSILNNDKKNKKKIQSEIKQKTDSLLDLLKKKKRK